MSMHVKADAFRHPPAAAYMPMHVKADAYRHPPATLLMATAYHPRIVSFVLLMLAALSASLTSPAQTYPFREYNIDDGLPQSETMAFFQDSRGYIWVSTRNGLARFDGHTFIPYLRKDGLPSNIVTRVIEDRGGTIWAFTSNGLARFNGKNFKRYPVPDSLRIKNLGFGCDLGDTATFLLSGSADAHSDKIILFSKGNYSDYASLHPVLYGTALSPAAFDTRDSALYLISTDQEVYKLINETLTLIHEGPVTKVLVTEGGPLFIDDAAEHELRYSMLETGTGGLIPDITDREGTSWFRTESRVFRLISDAFIEYEMDNGLPENTWALAADPSGGLWTGSINGELKYFDGHQFIERNEYRRLYESPPPFYRGSATLSNGEVWFSTGIGILIWDGKGFRRLDLHPESLQICIIYEDPVNGNILIGADKGLFVINDGEVTLYPQMSWLRNGIPEGIVRDHNGHYWIAGHYGMVFFDGTNFIPFRSAPAPVEMVWEWSATIKGTSGVQDLTGYSSATLTIRCSERHCLLKSTSRPTSYVTWEIKGSLLAV
ncbi:MAG: hypothetical protein U5L72_17710 [Bacteroidales bacterium]|nr:hypothetical protein [Bacteroidales bacterium]